MNRDSCIYKEASLATIVLWRVDELIPDLLFPTYTADANKRPPDLATVVARIAKIVDAYLKASSVPLFLATLPLPAALGATPCGGRLHHGISKAIAAFNTAIFELESTDSRIHVLDINCWAAQEGRNYYDLQMDFLARQPFKVSAAISLGFFLARNLRPLIVPRRKVLAVDLDNTLWGGILGEDGISQLKLGHDFPGNIFLAIQREIRALKQQGVLLVLVSKNDEASAREAFETLPNMFLGWDDFISKKVNFEPKYSNMREAASELGLSLDSFALLDDSDFEREQIGAFAPEITVLNDKGDALHMLTCLLQTDVFDTLRVTEEDLKRHRDYELRAARKASVKGDTGDFLSSLELRAVLEPVRPGNFERVVQMLGKTNQFNLTTRRHQLDDLRRLTSTPGAVSLALRLVDRFGDQGIVGVMLAVPDDKHDALIVDSFLVSCRALSRGVEEVLWAELVNRAVTAGMQRIYAHYLPTSKNALVSNLYDRFGLKRMNESNHSTDYLLEPIQNNTFPSWVAIDRTSL
jgi:FkbH-like protein